MLISKSENGWELHTITNDKLSCDNFSIESSADIDKIEKSILQKFGKRVKEEGVFISWDNWSGIFIMQMPGMNTASSDDLIKEIYEFLAKTDLPDD